MYRYRHANTSRAGCMRECGRHVMRDAVCKCSSAMHSSCIGHPTGTEGIYQGGKAHATCHFSTPSRLFALSRGGSSQNTRVRAGVSGAGLAGVHGTVHLGGGRRHPWGGRPIRHCSLASRCRRSCADCGCTAIRGCWGHAAGKHGCRVLVCLNSSRAIGAGDRLAGASHCLDCD